MDDGQRLFQLPSLLELPDIEAVEGSQRVVACHTGIAVEAVLPIEHNVHSRHDDTYEPECNTGTILEPDVDQSEYRGEDVEPVRFQKGHYHD